jgi:hypothetical protein
MPEHCEQSLYFSGQLYSYVIEIIGEATAEKYVG